MRHLILSFLMIMLILQIGNNVATAENAYFYFEQGEKYRVDENYDKAIEMYIKAIKLKPDYEIAYNNLGCVYYEKGMYEQAIGAYKKTLEINPNSKMTHGNLGCAYYKKGRYDEAIQEFKKELKNDPDCLDAITGIGSAYLKKEMFDEAIWWYKKAIEIDPTSTSAKDKLAKINKILEEKKQKERLEAERRQQERESYRKCYNLGIDEMNQKRWETAIEHLNKALKYASTEDDKIMVGEKLKQAQLGLNAEKERQNYWKWYKSGLDQLQQKRFDDAITNFNKALEYASTEDDKIMVGEKLKQAQQGLNAEKERQNYWKWYKSGLDQLQQKRFDDAITNFNKALEYASMEDDKIMVREKLKQAQQGLNAEKKRQNYWKWYKSGLDQLQQKRFEEATINFNKALGYANTWNEKGKIKQRLNEITRELNKQKQQQNYQKWFNLGMTRMSEERFKDAVENFNLALNYTTNKDEKIQVQEKIKEAKTRLNEEKQTRATVCLENTMPTIPTTAKTELSTIPPKLKSYGTGISTIASLLLIVILLLLLPQFNFLRTKIYLWQKRYDKVASIYEQAILKDKKIWLYPALANIYLKLDRIDKEAMKVYDKAIFLDSNNKKMLKTLADYYISEDKIGERAVEIYEETLKIDPYNIQLLNMLGKAYHNCGDDTKAIDIYQKLYELGQVDESVVKNLCRSYLKQNRLDDEVISIYEEALKYDPENHEIIIALSQAYLNKGMKDKRTVEIYRKSVSLCSNLVKTYREKNDLERAKRYADIAYKIAYCYSVGVVDSLVRESVMNVLNKW